VCQISKFLATKHSTINQLSLSENALKLTCGNVEFQNFPGRTPDPPLQGEGKGGWEQWKRDGEVGREELKGKEGKERGEKGGGEGRGISTPDVTDRSTPLPEVCICIAARHRTLIDCCSPVTLLLQNFLLIFELVSL
jgi:hypothetical protein